MDSSTNPPSNLNVNSGAGNPLYYNANSHTYTRSTNASLATPGGYDSLTTDGNGEAWFVFGLDPTRNLRFKTDDGNKVYIKVFFRTNDTPISDSAYVIGDKTPIQPLALKTFSNTADTTG